MAKQSKYWKEQSKLLWFTSVEEGQSISTESVKIGCLMRIADSLEKIEQPFADLISENKRLKESRIYHLSKIQTLEKRVAAFKGIINRMKRK